MTLFVLLNIFYLPKLFDISIEQHLLQLFQTFLAMYI